MRLKAPVGTDHVQTATAVYALDQEGCITVPDGHEDAALLSGPSFGFVPVPDNPFSKPAKTAKAEPTTTQAKV